MSVAAIIPVADRSDWLALRRSGIGASEAAAVLGVSPYASPREVYLDKLGKLPPVEETEAMRWGNLLEPLIAQEYTRRTGRAVVEQQVFMRHQTHQHILATLDGMTDQGWPVEFKTTGEWTAKDLGAEGSDHLPEHWIVQAHQQMLLTEAERVDFAVLVGGQNLRLYRVNRDQEIVDLLVERLGEFWDRVQRRDPPAELHRADRKLMHLIYPGCEGEIDLTNEIAATVDRYVELGAETRQLDDLRQRYKTSILESLKNNAVGYLPDGRLITRKIVEVGEAVVTRSAYTFVDLRIKKARKSK